MNKILHRILALAYGQYFNLIAIFSRKKAAKKAFLLFCTPRKGRVEKEQYEFLDMAKDQRIKFQEMELQTYLWQGPNETVLLLHGWESNVHRWRYLIPYLKKGGYNVVAFDAPAHGHSTGTILNVPIYTECTETIVKLYKPQIVIGHSMGGMNTLYLHEKHTIKHTKKIVTIGSPSRLQDIMAYYQHLLKFNDTVYNALDDYFHACYGFRISEFSTAGFKGHLSKKGLLIHDEDDTIAPFSASESVHDKWENSHFLKTKGLGHSMHQNEVNLQIMKFIKS